MTSIEVKENLSYLGSCVKPVMHKFISSCQTDFTKRNNILSLLVEFPFNHKIPGLVMIHSNYLSNEVNVIASCIHGLDKPEIMGSVYFMKFNNNQKDLLAPLSINELASVKEAIDGMKNTWLENYVTLHIGLVANYMKTGPHTKEEFQEISKKVDKLRYIRDALYE